MEGIITCWEVTKKEWKKERRKKNYTKNAGRARKKKAKARTGQEIKWPTSLHGWRHHRRHPWMQMLLLQTRISTGIGHHEQVPWRMRRQGWGHLSGMRKWWGHGGGRRDRCGDVLRPWDGLGHQLHIGHPHGHHPNWHLHHMHLHVWHRHAHTHVPNIHRSAMPSIVNRRSARG